MDHSPDFLIIGAARAGTTALHAYLRQHPDIFMPEAKELNYFAYAGRDLNVQGPGADFINNAITDGAAYAAHFAPARPGQVTGEASPLYLYEPDAPGNIATMAPEAKLIVILRNPIEQAYSHFMYATRSLVEDEPDFTRALALEEERLAKGWQPLFGYSRFPRYGEQLARYYALFDRAQIHLTTYEEFQADAPRVMRALFAFIGVDSGFQPDMSWRPNAGGVPKSQWFQDFLIKPNPITGMIAKLIPRAATNRIRDALVARNLKKNDSEVPQAARAILRARLADDIARLGEVTGRDFSYWLA